MRQMQKKLLCLLLASSMLTPSFSVLANEEMVEEDLTNESDLESQFDTMNEAEEYGDNDLYWYWYRYKENEKIISMLTTTGSKKNLGPIEDNKSTELIKNTPNRGYLYEGIFQQIPYGYDFVQTKAQLEATPWTTFEDVTNAIITDQKTLWSDYPEDVQKQMHTAQIGDVCWTIPLKKWTGTPSTPKTLNSDLPFFFTLAYKLSDDGKGNTHWITPRIHFDKVSDLNLDGSEQDRVNILNNHLGSAQTAYEISMKKPFSKDDLVEIKAGDDVVAYTLKNEYIDINAEPSPFNPNGIQDSQQPEQPAQDQPLEAKDIQVKVSLKKNMDPIVAGNLQFKAFFTNTQKEVPNCTFTNIYANNGQVRVDVSISGVKGSYATSKISQIAVGLDLNNPDIPVQKWAIRFGNQGIYTCDPKETDSAPIKVEEYISQVPKNYHLTGKPYDVTFATAATPEIVNDFKTLVMTLDVVQDKAPLVKEPTDFTILKVPYCNGVNKSKPDGFLEFNWKDLSNKTTLSQEELNKKLNIGKSTQDVPLSDENLDAIYYGNDSSEVEVDTYIAKTPILISSEGKTLDTVDENVKVVVELPESLESIEIPLKELAQDAANSTLSYVPNYEKIAEELNKKNLFNTSLPDGKSVPNYTFVVEEKPNATGQTTQNANDSKISLADLVDIKIGFSKESWIRLLLPKAQSQVAQLSMEDEILESGTGDTQYVGIEAKVEKVADENLKVTSASISAYIEKNKDRKTELVEAQVPSYFTLDLSKPQPYSAINNGYFEAEVTQGSAPVTSSNKGGSSKKPTQKPEEPAPTTAPTVGSPTTMYRLYNKLTGEHLFTTNKAEKDALLASDTWKDEGQGWIAPSTSDYPVYRLLNPNTGDHHYTTDKNEFDTLPAYGWIAEGIAFFSADKDNTENVILHRLYNPNQVEAGSHHYTADANERDALIAQGWTYEGTAWAGLPTH